MKWTVCGICITALVAVFFWASSGSGEAEVFIQHETVQAKESNTEIAVIAYNLGYASGPFNIDPNNEAEEAGRIPDEIVFNTNLTKLVKKIKEVEPDILLLQEVDFDSNRSYHTHQSAYLFANTALFTHRYDVANWSKRYTPYPLLEPTRWVGKLHSGQTILSRFTVTDYQSTLLEKPKRNYLYDRFYFERFLQEAVVLVGGQDIVILNVHLDAFNDEVNERQLMEVLHRVQQYKALGMPIILGGDFNRDITKGFEMVQEAGLEIAGGTPSLLTYPVANPKKAIDFLLYTKDSLELNDHKRLDDFGNISDHFPVYAVFSLKE